MARHETLPHARSRARGDKVNDQDQQLTEQYMRHVRAHIVWFVPGKFLRGIICQVAGHIPEFVEAGWHIDGRVRQFYKCVWCDSRGHFNES